MMNNATASRSHHPMRLVITTILVAAAVAAVDKEVNHHRQIHVGTSLSPEPSLRRKGKAPARTLQDGSCSPLLLDWSATADGTLLSGGEYITDQFKAYGVLVDIPCFPLTAFGELGPRIFDSNNPTGGDLDLGTPNENCIPPGPGVGEDGVPGSPFENCVSRGNLMIIQDYPPFAPNDHHNGGTIRFSFDQPLDMVSVGFLDLDSGIGPPLVISAEKPDGTVESFDFAKSGDNGYLEIATSITSMTELNFTLSGTGAITELMLCVPDVQSDIPSEAPSDAPSPGVGPSGGIDLTSTSPTTIGTTTTSDPPSPVPGVDPSLSPSREPLSSPSSLPSGAEVATTDPPSFSPLNELTSSPTMSPSLAPSIDPSFSPSSEPSSSPSALPSMVKVATTNPVASILPSEAGGDLNNVILGTTSFFNDGLPIPAGTYMIEYVDGCMKFHPANDWTVNSPIIPFAWWLVTDDDPPNRSTLSTTLPGTEGFFVPNAYRTLEECITGNKEVEPIIYEHAFDSPLGVWLEDPDYSDNVGEDGRTPKWKITPQ